MFFRGILLAAVALVPAGIRADVTVKRIERSGGFKGLGAFEGVSEHALQGLKRFDKSDVKYESRLMRMAAGKGPREQIVRVDKGVIWTVNTPKKSYTETPIALPAKKEASAPVDTQGKPAASAPDEKPTHRIKKTAVDVVKTGEKKKINGFDCERTKFTLVVEVEEIATGEVTTFNQLGDFWMTPLTASLKKAQEEESKFAKAYMEKLGLTLNPDDKKTFDENSVAMLLGVGGEKAADVLGSLRKKLSGLQGYSIVTETVWTVQQDPKAVARAKDAKAKARSEDTDSADVSADPKQLAGNLMGAFAKKKMREREDRKEKEREGKPLLSTYSEVQLVDLAPVSADHFEIPPGYKKTK